MEDIIALQLHVYSFTAPLPSRIHMWAVRALLHHLARGASKKWYRDYQPAWRAPYASGYMSLPFWPIPVWEASWRAGALGFSAVAKYMKQPAEIHGAHSESRLGSLR